MKKQNQYHCHCVVLLILVVFETLRQSSVEATTVGAEEEDSPLKALRAVTQSTWSFSKSTLYLSLLNDHSSEAMQDASDMDDDLTIQYHRAVPKTIKVKARVPLQRKLKKDGGGSEGKQDSGKMSKKGQTTTQDGEETSSVFFDTSTVGRQSIPMPTPVYDNIFNRNRSPAYNYNRPNFRPTNVAPYPRTTPRPRPTPVPTSEVTESSYPTETGTVSETFEYTTLAPSQ